RETSRKFGPVIPIAGRIPITVRMRCRSRGSRIPPHPLPATPESSREQDPQRRLAVPDLPPLDHRQRLRQRDRMRFDELVRLVISLALAQSGCHEEMNLLIAEAGRRKERRHELYEISRASGFLRQL